MELNISEMIFVRADNFWKYDHMTKRRIFFVCPLFKNSLRSENFRKLKNEVLKLLVLKQFAYEMSFRRQGTFYATLILQPIFLA